MTRTGYGNLNQVYRANLIKGPAKAVLCYLTIKADGATGDNAWPSISTMADECGFAESTIKSALKELEHHFCVIARSGLRKTRRGGRPVIVWKVLFDRLAEWSSPKNPPTFIAADDSKGREPSVPRGGSRLFQGAGAGYDLPLDLPSDPPSAEARPTGTRDIEDLVETFCDEADHIHHPDGYDLHERADVHLLIDDVLTLLAESGEYTDPVAYLTGRMAEEGGVSWCLAVLSVRRRLVKA